MEGAYTSCEDLPLYNYIRCLVYDDKSHLLIFRDRKMAGEHTEELNVIWESIQKQYMELMVHSIDMHAISLHHEIESLSIMKTVVENTVALMYRYPDPGFAAILQEYGFNFSFDISNEESYDKDIARVLKRLKKVEFDILDAQKKLNNTKKGETKVDVPFFDNILVMLSKFMGSHVDERVVTVSRYASMIQAYNKHIESFKTKANAGTRED